MTSKRILSISFTPLSTDARVQRQLHVLAEHGEVTTVGYGPALPVVDHHIEIPRDAPSLPQTVTGVVRLALHHHRQVELKAPGERAVIDAVDAAGPWDLVVANDARAFPLAFRAASGAPIWADMHEWAAAENANSPIWRLLVAPYMDALCSRYLPETAAATTVGGELSKLYASRYGIREPEIVRNAGPYQGLAPTPIERDRIRLVHSGIAVPERNIEALIDAIHALDQRFTLDLYLIGKADYLSRLRARARASDRIRFRDPVPTTALPETLNRYDLGVFLLPIKSLNNRLMLPNKFFDFVQARIGLVFGPSVETDRLITEHGLGIITAGWTANDLVTALQGLTEEEIRGYKTATSVAAKTLSSESDVATQHALVSRLLRTS